MRAASLWLLLGPTILVAGSLTPTGQRGDYAREIYPLLVKYCGPCHGEKNPQGGIPIASYRSADSVSRHPEAWSKIQRVLSARQMPPAGMTQPSPPEREKLLAFLRSAPNASPAPARKVTLRRLNREEYDNTIRDLIGIDLKPARDFPSDDVGEGFDNIGEVLSISPLLMEKYLAAADRVARAAIFVPGVRTYRVSGAQLSATNGSVAGEGHLLYSNGEASTEFVFPAGGTYRLRVGAYETHAGDENAKMALRLGGRDLKVVDVTAGQRRPQVVELMFDAPFGRVRVEAGFLNDFYRPRTESSPQEDRNLGITFIEVSGPIGEPSKLPPSHAQILFVRPDPAKPLEATRQILAAFATQAYRRPATKAQVDRLVEISEIGRKNGESFEKCIQLGITAALSSPAFLFRPESSPGNGLDDYELASRLSYFLWSSMPDAVLFDLADKKELRKPAVLSAQLRRMLADPRAAALGQNFAGQWLQIRKLSEVAPDAKSFPAFSQPLRAAMATETLLFFNDVVKQDCSVLDFLDSRRGFLNEALARLYGIPGVQGAHFREVRLPEERGGLLTQASILTVTSNPTRTSPVKRGKWVLENIFGAPPPPPPPDVGVLKDDEAAVLASTVRERMAQHRKDPNCASCHERFDGLGFALENFDGIGAWRTKDGPFDIDASGTLPDGSRFSGPVELRALLLRHKEEFVRCLIEKLLTYSLGRGLAAQDAETVDTIRLQVERNGYRFSALVEGIVTSEAFRSK